MSRKTTSITIKVIDDEKSGIRIHRGVEIKCSPGCHSSDIASAFGALADYLINHQGISFKTLLVWLLIEIKEARWGDA